MSTNPQDFLPTPSVWFARTLEYIGRCKAEFSSPRGSVEGPAKVSVHEAGHVSVEMLPEPDTLLTSSPSRYGLVGFIGGESFEQEQGGGVTKLDPFSTNPCTRLEVETPYGTFRTDDVPHYGREQDLY